MPKKPSTRFPFVNLKKALERAEAIYQNDRGGKGLSLPVAFSAWGYSSKSSGGFQTVGALKGYGLVEDEGSGDERVIKLTENGRRYFLSEIEEDRLALKRRFASSPALFGHLIEHWGGGVPDDPVARTHLKTFVELNEQSARSALGIFKDNLAFAPPKGVDKSSESISGSEGRSRIADEEEPEPEAGNRDRLDEKLEVDRSESGERKNSWRDSWEEAEARVADRDIFSVNEGEVVLISPKCLSEDSLQDILDWLDIMKRKLSRKVEAQI